MAGADTDVGPTAATLDDAFSQLSGAAVGLGLGAAGVAFAVRPGGRVANGLAAGLVGYLLVLVPALIAGAPADVSTGESIGTAAFGALLLVPAVALGAVLGSLATGSRRHAEPQ